MVSGVLGEETHSNHTYLRPLALIDVFCGGFIPILGIPLIDGEYIASLGDGHVGICQDKFTNSLHENIMRPCDLVG